VLPEFASALVFTGPDRILYTEKGGFGGIQDASVRIVENGVILAEPLITFDDVQTRSEMGLLGITLDPDYDSNQLVYAYFTHGSTNRNRVVRFRDQGDSMTDRDAAIIRDDLPADVCGNHQGGNIAFGPDGMLYVTLGDNGCNACNAQDPRTLAGKILRFTRDGDIPPDNPFPGPFPRSAFFAEGLRNSFDFTFHPRTGEIFATENGPRANDEINRILRGGNYGWPFFGCQSDRGNVCSFDRPAQTPPLRCYPSVIAPTGIAFYEGAAYPEEFRESLFYGDYNTGTLRRLALSADGREVLSADEAFLTGFPPIVDVVQGPDDLLYVLTEEDIQRIDFVEN
jgi:glucose/arabinose dehydrogenase